MLKRILCVGIFLFGVSIVAFGENSATATTDRRDYNRGDAVRITGTGFQAGETVDVLITSDDANQSRNEIDVVASSDGAFDSGLMSVPGSSTSYTVQTRGLSSGTIATTLFYVHD